MNFILDEHEALKEHVSGLTVADGANPSRPVPVWYSQPDQEIQPQTFPYITIDFLDLMENTPQVQSTYGDLGDGNTPYLLDGLNYDSNSQAPGGYTLTPCLLLYQVQAWSRIPRHDASIVSQLVTGPLHPRFAQLQVGATMRRLVVTNYRRRGTTTDSKPLYRNIWTIQIPSEFFFDPLTLTTRVGSVIINGDQPRTLPTGWTGPVLYP